MAQNDLRLESAIRDWLSSRAPSDVPVELVRRIEAIPLAVTPARAPTSAATRRRHPPLLLAAAVAGCALALIGGGLLIGAARRDADRRTTPTDRVVASTAPIVTATAAAPGDATAGVGLWPADFRSSGLLPSTIDRSIEHGTITTPLGRARWVHFRGDATSLPDPLVPFQAPDGSLVWFRSDGTTQPSVAVSDGLLSERRHPSLPARVVDPSLYLVDDTFWFVASDPPQAWSATHLGAWRATDLSRLRSPIPASLRWDMALAARAVTPDGTTIADVTWTIHDPGSLLGYPGRRVNLVKDGPSGFAAEEHNPHGLGWNRLGGVTVTATKHGIVFSNDAGKQVGRVDGVGLEFAERLASGGIDAHQLAYLDGDAWTPIDLPDGPLDGWPTVVTVGSETVALVVEPDASVRSWRTVDGRTWTAGDAILGPGGEVWRADGVVERDDGGANRIISLPARGGGDSLQSADGTHWAPAPAPGDAPPPVRFDGGWLRTPDQTADGSWQTSSDGTTWAAVPALGSVVTKSSPGGAGGTSASAIGNVVLFSVTEDSPPSDRDLWMIEFEH